MKYIKNAYLLVFLLIASHLQAQKEFNVWYFGDGAGIDFNSGTPVPLTDGKMKAVEGCASVSDCSGNLLFYTNGIEVWDKTHTVMLNGSGLRGNASSTQSATIVKKPGSDSLYYIFTVDAKHSRRYGMRYSVLDMSLNGGLGDIGSLKNIVVEASSGENLTVIKHENDIDFWIITQVNKNAENVFQTYLLTLLGLSTSPVSTVNGASIPENRFAGFLRSSRDGRRIANASSSNYKIEVFDFDKVTGELSNLIELKFNDNRVYTWFVNIYSLEFSPSGRYLYATTSNSDYLIQFDLTAGAQSLIRNSLVVIDSFNNVNKNFGALQMGPDLKIYSVSYNNYPGTNEYLGIINNPDSPGLACGYISRGLYLGGKKSIVGLPSFTHSSKKDHSIQFDGFCLEDTTVFKVTSLCVDSVLWDFGDVNSGSKNLSKIRNPKHVFTEGGTFNVTLVLHSGNSSDTIIELVVIGKKPRVYLGSDTAFCNQFTHRLEGGSNFNTYNWSTGDTISAITVDTEGVYWVTVEDSLSCGVGGDTIKIDEIKKPFIEIIEDSSNCDYIYLNVESQDGITYIWNTTDTGTALRINQKGWYSITASHFFCKKEDSIWINIVPKPIVDIGPDTMFCSDALLLQSQEKGAHLWSTGESEDSILVQQNSSDVNVVYWLNITRNNCTQSDTIDIIPCKANQLFVPNAFSPNGDKLNDLFVPVGIENSRYYHIQIFNRWGEKIFESSNSQNHWDGRFMDSNSQTGVYLFLIDLVDATGSRHHHSGDVTLVR
ncbi:MAG: gliding motility-associated-like protein [Marivirga sp.]